MIHIFISCVRNTPGSKLDSGLLWSSKTQCGHFKSHRVKATNKNYPAIRQHLFHPSFIPVSSIPHHHPTMARSRPGTCLSPIALNMLLKLLAALCSIALISWNQQDHKSTLSSNEKKTWKIMGKSWKKTSINGGVCLGKSSNCC